MYGKLTLTDSQVYLSSVFNMLLAVIFAVIAVVTLYICGSHCQSTRRIREYNSSDVDISHKAARASILASNSYNTVIAFEESIRAVVLMEVLQRYHTQDELSSEHVARYTSMLASYRTQVANVKSTLMSFLPESMCIHQHETESKYSCNIDSTLAYE